MDQVRVRINADDFGHSHEVNEAVVKAFRRGILNSASLMPTGEAFHEAVEMAGMNPGLSVGIHLVTVMGRSVLPHSEIPDITDLDGRFPHDPAIAGLKYFFSMRGRQQVFKELEAQFEMFCSTGMTPSHADSHLHMHIHPVIFQAALTLAGRYGVKQIRVPVDDLFIALHHDRSKILQKVVETMVFRILTRRMRRTLDTLGFGFCDHVHGHLLSGRMTEEYVLHVLKRLKPGKTEIYFHPTFHSGQEDPTGRQRQGWEEYKILTSKRVIQRMAALNSHSHKSSSREEKL